MNLSFNICVFYFEQDEPFVRGFREENTSLLSHLYLILRSSRQHRRSFLLSLLRMIDDEKVCSNIKVKNCLFQRFRFGYNVSFF